MITNEAFEKWYKPVHGHVDLPWFEKDMAKCWQAAKADSEHEIVELKAELERKGQNLNAIENVATELQASNNILREALQNILDGNYPSPRSDRGKQCDHGKYYWEDCTNCIDDYIQPILAAAPSHSLAEHDNELLEKCAEICEREDKFHYPEQAGDLAAIYIRALKESL